jgi:large subunit ribosomal protein L24
MATRHVKKGDEVVIIAGSARGNRGKVIEVLPGKNRCIIEGLNMIKKHTKRSQQFPEGRIVEREGTIHISNVMRADRFDARVTKRGGTPAPKAEAAE